MHVVDHAVVVALVTLLAAHRSARMEELGGGLEFVGIRTLSEEGVAGVTFVGDGEFPVGGHVLSIVAAHASRELLVPDVDGIFFPV